MPQEDVAIPRLDPFVQLLHELQFYGHSVNWNRRKDELNVYPDPSDEMVAKITANFERLKYLLPGICDTCLQWSIRRFECYWTANPHLCSRCTLLSTRLFTRLDQWPEAVWDDETL
jgi:hypothetical protein